MLCVRLRGQAALERAGRLCGDLSQGAAPVRRLRSSAGACGLPALAARRPPTAMRRWDRTARPASFIGTAVGADYRFSPRYHRRLRAGRRRHQFQRRQWRFRAFRSVPGRRLHPAHVGAAYMSAALAYGWQDVTTDRTVHCRRDQLRARFNANAFSGRVEGGYRWVMPWMDGLA